jgi:pathogenesis-related protein 1
MKKVILSLLLCSFLYGSLNAQDVFLIKNFWKGSYLNTESGTLQVSDINPDSESAQWNLIDVGNGQYQIMNPATNTYLNFAQNQLSNSVSGNASLDNLWELEKLPDGDHVRIKNVQQPDSYLNIERGLACSPVQSHWHSAMWFIERPAAVTNFQNNTGVPLNSQANTTNTDGYFNAQLALDAHNQLRDEVGVPPLVWDDRLAQIAQEFANRLALKNRGEEFVLEHSQTPGLGENVAGGFVTGDRPEIRIFKGWGTNEKVNFNPATKRCYDGKICGHYTQIVWRNTTKVGCAVTINENGKYILVCNYDPRGNFNGETPF